MEKTPEVKLLILFFILMSGNIQAQKERPYASWNFDIIDKNEKVTPASFQKRDAPTIERIYSIKDEISGATGRIIGNFFKLVPGVAGNALLLDGFTSFVECQEISSPESSEGFSIGVWIAPGAYPTNWCPVADQSSAAGKGYFLGLDAYGHAGFKLYAGGRLFEIQSDERIPLKKWTHMEWLYSSSDGIALYLDGKMVASLKTEGEFEPAFGNILLIGKHSIKQKPEGMLFPKSTEAVYTYYDGLIDELKIYNQRLSSIELSEYVSQSKPSVPPSFVVRTLPSTTSKSGRFGAIYTTLNYYDAWDALWHIGNEADVVVSFDNIEGSFNFWRGTSYVPHWVTENGFWYNNGFTETWSSKGCHEPMSDKRCEFSHVRVLENTDARIVVHWRYALVDNWYNMVRVDTLTGWGEWTDEVYTIYPDGVAVRKITLHSSQPKTPHEYHEGIIVMGPGQRPEDVLQTSALTLGNMKGETYTYSWEKGIPPEADKKGFVSLPAEANIHLVNTKSKLKPFVIVAPQSKPEWDIFSFGVRPDFSKFPWWNHWPTAQKPTDGRNAMDSDQPSHSSLSHANWDAYNLKESSLTKLMLNGLTVKSAADLVPLAKSWAYPAELKISGSEKYVSNGYDPEERVYNITCSANDNHENLDLILNASSEYPVVNMCFVIKNWGTTDVSLKIDKTRIKRGKTFRYGFRNGMKGTDLIVWIEKESALPVKITLIPGKE